MAPWITSRRELIVSALTGAAGISFGFSIPWLSQGAGEAHAAEDAATLLSFIKIYSDNRIEVVVAKAEMGQGVLTSLAMLICEDLEANWPEVTVRLEGEVPPYLDPSSGMGATAGSSSVRTQYRRLRLIGATVRDTLLEAAARAYNLAPNALRAQDAKIYDQSGTLVCTYGQIARSALELKLATAPQLKPSSACRLIGQRISSKDNLEKIEGRAVYGIDVKVPGMLYGAIRHHPSFGSQLSNFSELALAVPETFRLFELPGALGIVGPSYWQGQRILSSLPAVYSLSDAQKARQQAAMEQLLLDAVQNESTPPAATKGDPLAALASSESRLEAIYSVPYLAHGAMEPMCATADVRADRCELWLPTQGAGGAKNAVARALKRAPETIKVNVTFLGGGFGRKIENDAAVQAAQLSEKAGQPVKLIWSRAEDTQHDVYRPIFAARMVAGLGPEGLKVWFAKNAGPSILKRATGVSRGVDPTSLDGFSDLPYPGIAQLRILQEEVDLGIPVGFWRSVGKSQNTYFVECFLDEIAAKLGRDPLDFRLELLAGKPRAQKILETLAEVSGWRESPERRRMGLAYMEGYGSLAGAVAQVAIENKKVRVEKIFVVVDCGTVVNRQGAEAQIQGGALYGLGAALYGKVTIKEGRVEQSIFAEAPFLRIADAPSVSVTFIDSGAEIGGLGEVSTPLAAPAVCNAIFSQTGQMIRKLPIADFVF